MRRRSLLLCAGLGVIGLTAFAAPAKADRWLTYHNDRYGTTIDYPDQFKPEPPPDADDGRRFKDAQGVEFAVYASYNALDFNLAKYQDYTLKNLDPGQVVTYQAHGGDWFVISGTKGDSVFYQRHLLSHGGQMTEAFAITYPAAAKLTYDPLVARMAKSLRPGKGFQSP
jgi:serine/threonine-protein kinase